MQKKVFRHSFLLILGCLIFANAAVAMNPQNTTRDKFEGYNRVVFRLNDFLDHYFLTPIALLYNRIVPRPLNKGIHNVFLNVGEIHTIGNDALQLHFAQMLNDMWRFSINTTVGIGGLFDVAGRMQLPYYSNDFGLTMAYYGYTDSNYFMIPLYGPSTIRDTLAMPVDYYAFDVYRFIEPTWKKYAVYGLSVVDKRVQLLQFQNLLFVAAVDKYSFIRSAYLQRRAHQIEENRQLGYTGRANMPNDQEPVVAAGG